jgi:hypothetical protein
MQKKIQDFMQLKSNGAHSRGFEARIVRKVHYAIYIVIEVFKKICSECHMRGCAYVKKLGIFLRTILQ